ncbi:glycosyltransferase family 33 protein [Hypoxylon fragiforme]|uniref:glycosyltransferase family 33 protein n=1 Tax=Hypoxylon fragiforme TaxID=63214 RepID=UPI0020C6DA9C|nr:glycosyltransferase family 33 protein [Hypoxylon fragiforme]KAI2606983.1 glycosyltransferase family 33 protein [Hypoxylon fragiforme]
MAYLAIVLSFTAVGLLLGLVVVLTMLPSRYVKKHSPTASKEESAVSVQVLVLGDIGRSPRMQYHALSIARHGGSVDLIGYLESTPHPDLLSNPRIKIYPLATPPSLLKSSSLPFIISGPLKVLWQIWTLVHVLGYQTPPARWLLVQNPPSIPTLAIALLVSILRNTHLMIDWHNYGWTILAGTKGRNHPFVQISKAYECALGQAAPTANVTVTHAMKRQLERAPYNVTAPIHVLHDRPAAIFHPLKSLSDRKDFLERLPETRDFASNILAGDTRLIVSSTSWTPDEDFSLLLDALVTYAKQPQQQQQQQQQDTSCPIIAIITGKGPQKAFYEGKIRELQKTGRLPNIRILTAWLSMEDYANLLRCADLGICLHMSSSGVDLPMKVVDMFGSGLPVAAYSGYESFDELVKEGVNGLGFETADKLAAILKRLFSNEGLAELRTLGEGAKKESNLRWDEEWDRILGRVLGVMD